MVVIRRLTRGNEHELEEVHCIESGLVRLCYRLRE